MKWIQSISTPPITSPGGCRDESLSILMKAMESRLRSHRELTMHQREHIVIVRPGTRGMTLHTMFYSNEIRAAESVPTDKIEVKEQERSSRDNSLKVLRLLSSHKNIGTSIKRMCGR